MSYHHGHCHDHSGLLFREHGNRDSMNTSLYQAHDASHHDVVAILNVVYHYLGDGLDLCPCSYLYLYHGGRREMTV